MLSIPARAMRAGAVGVTLCAAALGACSDSTRPPAEQLTGRYTLFSVDGDTLPIVVFAGLDGSTRRLVSGALEFRTRGRLMDIRTFQTLSPILGAGPLQTDSTAFGYEVTDGKIFIHHPMPYEPDTYVDTGSVGDGLISITARTRRSFFDVHSAVGGTMLYVRRGSD
jgi:hypothetical protein